jgi:hypothetical protein
MDGKDQKNDTGYTVDATGIKLTATGNNRYTLEGIEVGTAENVAPDTQIVFTVSVVDADGNVLYTTPEKITATIAGEKKTPVTPAPAPTAKTLTEEILIDGNTKATYSFTSEDLGGWTVDTTATITNPTGVKSVKVDGNTITLELSAAYDDATTPKTVTVKIPVKKGEDTNTWEVTLPYKGAVERATIALADGEDAPKAWSNSIEYTLKEATGWKFEVITEGKVYVDSNCETPVDGATAEIEGTTLKLNGVEDPGENIKTVYVMVKATKAGQNRTEPTTLTLKYQNNG